MLILVTAFCLPVFAGAIFGGLVLSRWGGWIAGLLFGSGWALIVFLISNDSFRLIYDGRSLGPIPFLEDVWRFIAVVGGGHEKRIRDWAATQHIGGHALQVFGAPEVFTTVREVARSKQYRDSPALATLTVLEATGALKSA